MKKILLPIYNLLVCLLLSQLSFAESNPGCVKSAECFEFTFKGATVNSNATVTLGFQVKVNCDRDLSNVAIELPAGAKASDYSPKSGVENPANTPFNAIKFQTAAGYKNGKTADFSYTITSLQYAGMTSLRIEAKASTLVGRVSFDPKSCSPATPPATGDTDNSDEVGKDRDEDGKKDHDHNGDGKGDGCDDDDHKSNDPKHQPGQACVNSQPRPITGNQHPCPGDIEYYSIEDDRGYTSFVWDVPRAMAGNPPGGWEILEGQGTNRVKVRVGEKSGTMKVKVTDPECGTKVATLPVKPGKSFEVTITGPDSACVSELQVYRASVSRNGNGSDPKTGEFLYAWTVPADWVIVEGQGTAQITVKPGATDGDVSVTVRDNAAVSGNGNNGTGVGGYKDGYCGLASDRIRVTTREDCGTICPTPVVTIAGPDSVCAFQDEPVTYTANASGTTETATYVWTVPADWAILSGEGTASIQVQVGSESGQVTVTLANACGTAAADTYDVFANEECGSITPLPVELISFEGEATKSGVLLEWATATEKNNDRFEVERSADGLTFAKIGQVKGNGTTTAKRTYSMRDAKASRGTLYYRLKQVDLDGAAEYSKMIVVENNASAGAAAGIMIAPNPANGQFTIALDSTDGAQLQILDMNGNLLHMQSLAQGAREMSFNTSSLGMRSGLYLISIKSAAGSSQAKLVVR